MTAFVGVLRHELARVGRPAADITVTADERTVTLMDIDGSWRGPPPIAYGALVRFDNDEGKSGEFWSRLDREHGSRA
jgi:hypothetical protein